MENSNLQIPTLCTINDASKATGIPAFRIRQWYLNSQIVGVRCGHNKERGKILINMQMLVHFLNTAKNGEVNNG